VGSWGKLNFAQKTCVSSAGKLMHQTGMITDGTRVGVALSGGVDSWVLLKVLTIRKMILPFRIELMVLHVNPGFDPNFHRPLADWVERNGLASHFEISDHGPRAHSKENRKNSPCFFCCRRRRKRLFELCRKYGLTHLAFGHNTDDLAATFFMNLFQAGKVQGMSISDDFFQGGLKVVRPLLWLDKSMLVKAARAWELPVLENPCPSAADSKRSEIMDWLGRKWKREGRTRRNVFNALRRMALDEALKKV